MRGRATLLLIFVLAGLVAPTAALASVKLVFLSSPNRPGSHATLVAAVSRPATCSITVLYKSGSSHARGLTSRKPSGGKVSWTWMVGTNTTPGRWPIYVDCGSAGILRTNLVVR
jgi:micrococcal nuclease